MANRIQDINEVGGRPNLAHRSHLGQQSEFLWFDLGEVAATKIFPCRGNNSTGLFQGGQYPTVPAVNLTGSGINLHSGDIFQVHMSYDGSSTLALTITDTATAAVFNQNFAVNIAQALGQTNGYVGFTGGTGGLTAIQKILTWNFSGK